MSIGIVFTYLGLIIFLTSVNVGFMPIGYKMGLQLGNNQIILVICAFVLGLVVVLVASFGVVIMLIKSLRRKYLLKKIDKKSAIVIIIGFIGIAIIFISEFDFKNNENIVMFISNKNNFWILITILLSSRLFYLIGLIVLCSKNVYCDCI